MDGKNDGLFISIILLAVTSSSTLLLVHGTAIMTLTFVLSQSSEHFQPTTTLVHWDPTGKVRSVNRRENFIFSYNLILEYLSQIKPNKECAKAWKNEPLEAAQNNLPVKWRLSASNTVARIAVASPMSLSNSKSPLDNTVFGTRRPKSNFNANCHVSVGNNVSWSCIKFVKYFNGY